MTGRVLHRLDAHLKVLGWSSDLSTPLTRKFPMFLLLFNEISLGYDKILPVSLSFWSKVNKSDVFGCTAGWMILKGV